jgi:hypothetical protein
MTDEQEPEPSTQERPARNAHVPDKLPPYEPLPSPDRAAVIAAAHRIQAAFRAHQEADAQAYRETVAEYKANNWHIEASTGFYYARRHRREQIAGCPYPYDELMDNAALFCALIADAFPQTEPPADALPNGGGDGGGDGGGGDAIKEIPSC